MPQYREFRHFTVDAYGRRFEEALAVFSSTGSADELLNIAREVVDASKIHRCDRPVYFDLSPKETASFEAWYEQIQAKGAKLQRERAREAGASAEAEMNHLQSLCVDGPYTGAIGGALTFHITNTSIGIVTKVSDSVTGETIDLTEYGAW